MEGKGRILHFSKCIPFVGCRWKRRMKNYTCRKGSTIPPFRPLLMLVRSAAFIWPSTVDRISLASLVKFVKMSNPLMGAYNLKLAMLP